MAAKRTNLASQPAAKPENAKKAATKTVAAAKATTKAKAPALPKASLAADKPKRPPKTAEVETSTVVAATSSPGARSAATAASVTPGPAKKKPNLRPAVKTYGSGGPSNAAPTKRSPSVRLRRPPSHEALVRDLGKLRLGGITKLRGMKLDALTEACVLVHEGSVRTPKSDATPSLDKQYIPQVIEELLRRAIDRMEDGLFAATAEILFGLAQGTRGTSPTDLRREAAAKRNISTETFRKEPEQTTLSEVAEAILGICHDQEMRDARLSMETRHPADSRLAVSWVERFEDYYRIWTPVYALAADLSAYRATLLDEDRPYDRPEEEGRRLDPMTLETEGYTQEYEAEGYIRFALYRFAEFLSEMHRFCVRRGGFWLLSSPQVEEAARDAIYRIGWYTPNNERDDSWMRITMKQSDGELHQFQHLLKSTTIGQGTHAEWQQWASECACTFDTKRREEERGTYFATKDTDPGIAEDCALHQVIAACQDYLAIIDRDWLGVADWYGVG